MQDNKRNFADVDRDPTPNHDDASGRLQLSANMTRRLKWLGPLRIRPSSIKFSEFAPKFGGGCAVVSRALLFYSSAADDAKAQSPELKPGGLTTSFESEVANNGEAEGSHEEEGRRNEGATEGQDGECDGETSVGRKLKPVAVKKMKVKTKSDALKVLGLTIREAEFLASHSHDNIIKLEGFVEDLSKNLFWLIFPWEKNGTLKEFIASAKCEIPERISLLRDVATGVEYLHSRNPSICHGDLKSGNILVNSECRAVLADFGSAHHLDTRSHSKQTKRARFGPQPGPAGSSEESFCLPTNTITLTYNKYTLRWAAPELLCQDDAGLASDVWAFGCVAYEAITELIPFQDVKDDMVVMRIVRGDLPNISGDPGMVLIQALCTLVRECWNINPSKRPTAEQCREAIKWMPMVIPNRVRSAAATNLMGRSAEVFMQLGYMHQKQSHYPNALKCFARAFRLSGDVADRNGKANALLGLAEAHRLQNEHSQAITFYSQCLRIQADLGNRLGRADALIGLAHVHRARHEYCQAVTFLSECLQILTDVGDRNRRADALFCLADVHRVRSEYNQAVMFYSECLQIRTDIGDRRGRAEALQGLAEVHRRRNECVQAVTLLSECLQIRTDIGDRQGRAEALWGLAEVHRLRNEYDQAFTLFSECLQIRTDIGDRQGRAEALIGLAEVHRFRNEYNQATTLYSECLQIRTINGDRQGRAEALWGLAEVYQLQNESDQAVTLFYESLQIRNDIGDRQGSAEALWGLAEDRILNEYSQAIILHSELARSRYEEAEKAFISAHEIHSRIGNDLGSANALYGLGETYRARSRNEEAERAFIEAHEIHSRIGHDLGSANALDGLGQIYRARSKHEEAKRAFIEAHEIHSRIGHDLGSANALDGLGQIYRARSKHEEAKRAFIEAHEIHSRIGNDLGSANALDGLGQIYRARSRNEEAEQAFIEAHEIHSRIGNDLGSANALDGLGKTYQSRSRDEEAEQAFIAAHEIHSRIENDWALQTRCPAWAIRIQLLRRPW